MFFDIFNSLCQINGETANSVCRKLGFSNSTASYWKKSPNPPKREALEKIAEYFGVSVNYLLGKDDPALKSNVGAVHTDNIRMIPVYESVSAGFGAYADNHIISYQPLLVVSDYEAEETLCIRVTGDSMYPKIEDGDLIQVHKQDSVDSGDIAVMLLDGEEGLVKKVKYGSDWIELVSLNPMYSPRRFEGEDVMRLRVVGKVKAVIHKF